MGAEARLLWHGGIPAAARAGQGSEATVRRCPYETYDVAANTGWASGDTDHRW